MDLQSARKSSCEQVQCGGTKLSINLIILSLWLLCQWIPWVHSQKMKMDVLSSWSFWTISASLWDFIEREVRRRNKLLKLHRIRWVGNFGVSKEIRSDGRSPFTSKLPENLSALLGYKHLVVVSYRPQANGSPRDAWQRSWNTYVLWWLRNE